jgi:mannan endo-1,4-beta-mannosidase
MKKNRFFIPLIFLFLVTVNCKSTGKVRLERNSFVKVKDGKFILNGKPYFFLGTNLWYGAYLGSTAKYGDRKRLIRELDKLASLGIRNLRILAASEGSEDVDFRVRPSFQSAPGVYNEELFAGLDFLLSEMEKRSMKAVLFLNNYWVWSGGMAQYVSWIEDKAVPNPFLEQYDWVEFMNFSARFYSNKKVDKYYRDYVKVLLNRKNKFTGRFYKNDPTIMAWELANEPRPGRREGSGMENREVFNKWIDGTADFIKAIDTNHLITTGSEGTAGSIDSVSIFIEAHDGENIDYVTAHLWVLNWVWFNPERPDETYPEAESKAIEYLQRHVDYADSLGKPIVFDEFGIPRDNHSFSPSSTTVARDKFFTKIFSFIYDKCEEGTAAAGSNFWGWGGEGMPGDPSGGSKWKYGDDYTGDPPQEPQGRNSVFSSDTSTLRILKKFANKMDSLCE